MSRGLGDVYKRQVKDADKIVVLDKGCIVEEGTHRELTERKGLYYRLVKNQLELGS